VMRPLTPAELGAVPLGDGLFYDPEQPDRPVPASPAVDRQFARRVAAYYSGLRDRLRERGAEFVPLTTAEPVEHALSAWLRGRRR
jgi:hypothetical protein